MDRAAQAAQARVRAQRQALRALRRAQQAAAVSGVALSDWEGEFLGSVETRVKTYGRAFADPEKGAQGAALSQQQGRKLKEITAKAKGEEKPGRAVSKGRRASPRWGAGARSPQAPPEAED